MTITGTSLATVSSVTFGGVPGIITARTDSQVTVTTPPGTAGPVDVDVVTSTGRVTIAAGFTYGQQGPPGPISLLAPSAPIPDEVAPGDASAEVTWLPPESNGSFPVSKYQVRSVPSDSTCTVDVTVSSCALAGLTNGVAYSFQVRALNGAGWSAWSQPSETVVPAKQAVVPGRVRDLRVVDVSSGRVTLRWRAPIEDGGAPVEYYRVWSRKVGQTDWVRSGGESAKRTVMVTGLEPGHAYRFKVAAVNEMGPGRASHVHGKVRIPKPSP